MNTLFKTITSAPTSKGGSSVVSFQQFQDAPQDIEHKILIEELELDMFIGILPEEQENKQRVLIDLDVSLEPKTSYEEAIDNTVSYADIIQDIEKLATSKHFNLVETLAENITALCFTHTAVQQVQISVKKPDIIANTKTVGFSMTRAKAK